MFRAIKKSSIFRDYKYFSSNPALKNEPGNIAVDHIQNKKAKITESKKIKVVSLDAGGPIANLSISFHAGARFENNTDIGITHYIRRSIGLKSKNGSQFLSTRTGQQYGISVSCTADRELITVAIRCTRVAVSEALYCLKQAICEPLYLPWEIKANEHYINEDLARQSGASQTYNLLHKVAFRTALGNSLYCPRYHVGTFDSNKLHSYYKRYMRADRCTLAGINIEHGSLLEFASSLNLSTNGKTSEESLESKFYGGERRLHTHDRRWANVAIATEGAPLGCADTAYSFAILQHIWGYGPRINFTASHPAAIGSISKAIKSAVPDAVYRCSAINACYQDIGLFGFIVSCDEKAMRPVLQATMELFKKGEVSEKDVQMGKTSLKTEICYAMESQENMLTEIGGQAMLFGRIASLSDILDAIDHVCIDDVLKLARLVANGKLAMAAVGNLESVPYLDDLE